MQPERRERGKETLASFKERTAPTVIIDEYPSLLRELYEVRTPALKFDPSLQSEVEQFVAANAGDDSGEWFFYPDSRILLHALSEPEHFEVRTARNRNIITSEEQHKLYDLRVAYAGLSVGSHGALTFAHLGGGRRIALADPDTVSLSNLNRIRYDLSAIGKKKTELVSQHLYHLDPYAHIERFDGGVNGDNIDTFLSGRDVLVEETDNLEMKIRLRLLARERRIPVLMATDNGHNVIVDVERFDLEPDLPLFNGAVPEDSLKDFASFAPHELPRLATKIAGPSFVTERMMLSLQEVGKTLYSWPQLADAATLAGVAIAFLLSRIALGERLDSGKKEVHLEAIFDPEHDEPANRARREGVRDAFLSRLGLR